MKINWKKLILIIIVTFLIGSFFALFVDSKNAYENLNRPPLTPPALAFPIAWSILYLLMAISYYMVCRTDYEDKSKANFLYFTQLVVNSLWTLIAFGFNLRLLSFIWIIALFILALLMVIEFFKINKISAYLQIPYLVWLLFAGYLSLGIYILN